MNLANWRMTVLRPWAVKFFTHGPVICFCLLQGAVRFAPREHLLLSHHQERVAAAE
jgi:hypothetical protein